jgi:hypothetical protein
MKRTKIYLGIFTISALIIMGIYLPKLYSIVYDKNSLNQIEYMQADMNIYEYKGFSSFKDKLAVIASHIAGSSEIKPVQLSVSDSFSNEEVIDNMKLQLQNLYESKLLTTLPEINDDDLQSIKLYTIYPDSADMDSLSGITYWKIALNDGNSYDMTVYMDTEFGKIYFSKISTEDLTSDYKERFSADWIDEFMEYYEMSEEKAKYFTKEPLPVSLALLYIDGYTLECARYIGAVENEKDYLFLGFIVFNE